MSRNQSIMRLVINSTQKFNLVKLLIKLNQSSDRYVRLFLYFSFKFSHTHQHKTKNSYLVASKVEWKHLHVLVIFSMSNQLWSVHLCFDFKSIFQVDDDGSSYLSGVHLDVCSISTTHITFIGPIPLLISLIFLLGRIIVFHLDTVVHTMHFSPSRSRGWRRINKNYCSLSKSNIIRWQFAFS